MTPDPDSIRAARPTFFLNAICRIALNCLPSAMILTLLSSLLCAFIAAASEFSGVATLTSEYIYRGLEMSEGDPALQLGLDYEHDSGLFVGVWASTIDIRTAMGSRDTELDYYAGFHYAATSPLTATVTLLRYSYPGQTGMHRYDYAEVLVNATWRDRYSMELGYTSNLYGLDRIGRHWELRTEWPVANAWVISAALGGNDMSDASVSPYLHWNVGASTRLSRLTLDLRWYNNERPDGFATQLSASSQLVLSISTAFLIDIQ